MYESLIFTTYLTEKSHLLIDQFIEENWFFGFNDLNNEINLPDIVLSKDIIKYSDFKKNRRLNIASNIEEDNLFYNNFCIELLGEYKIDKPYKEGRVVLYYNKIMECAKALESKLKIKNTFIFNELVEIVFIHELVHWIMHFPLNPFDKKFINSIIKYKTLDEVSFHETFAQLFTFFYCNLNPTKKKIFETLNVKQPIQYRQFNTLIDYSDLNTPIISIRNLVLMQILDIQSFKNLQTVCDIEYNFKNMNLINKTQLLQIKNNPNLSIPSYRHYIQEFFPRLSTVLIM